MSCVTKHATALYEQNVRKIANVKISRKIVCQKKGLETENSVYNWKPASQCNDKHELWKYLGWIQECSSCWHIEREAIIGDWLGSSRVGGHLALSLIHHVTMLSQNGQNLSFSVRLTPKCHINRHVVHVVSTTRHDAAWSTHFTRTHATCKSSTASTTTGGR